MTAFICRPCDRLYAFESEDAERERCPYCAEILNCCNREELRHFSMSEPAAMDEEVPALAGER